MARTKIDTYTINVGNLGNVAQGIDKVHADHMFVNWVTLSASRYGRVASEPVYMLRDSDGELVREYEPKELAR